MPRIHRPKQHIRLAFDVLVLLFLISACTPALGISVFEKTPIPPTPQPPTLIAEVVFRVQIPLNTPKDRPVFFEIVDEVTGVGLNPLRYRMESTSTNHYTIRLPIPLGSIVQYRYVLGGDSYSIEYSAKGSQVRYRVFPVSGPVTIQDIISGWREFPYAGQTGRIFGTITDHQTGNPVVDALVTAGGVQVISAADGSFLLDGIPPGTHHVVAFSINGDYAAYEQGALVEPGSATYAELKMMPTESVSVTFIVKSPKLPNEIAQIRFIGNLYQLGKTYGDLGAGINTLASRAPVLSPYTDDKFAITLQLPVGFDLHYKYSLGDGFWNAEHKDGTFRVRRLIVPAEDIIIEDTVDEWASSGSSAAVIFNVQTPVDTPADDIISIQFNPYTWMEPIPMWRTGLNEWNFTITSPLHLLGDVYYRYCRNDQCTNIEAAAPSSTEAVEMFFSGSSQTQYFQDQIERWPDWSPVERVTTVPSMAIDVRGSSFVAGVEYAPQYHPGWTAYQKFSLTGVSALNGNLLVLRPTWTYTQQNPPLLAAVPGQNGLWADWENLADDAQKMQIPLAIYPLPTVATGLTEWWETADRDLSWWYSWYDRYQTFLLHHASFAEQVGARALIIGGPEVAPSFPKGRLPDGSPSGTPDEAESRWREIIVEVRKRYSGPLMLALPYHGEYVSPPPFLQEFDQVYLLWHAPLMDKTEASYVELSAEFDNLLERDVRPLRFNSGKPIVVAISYPSIDGAMQGCRLYDLDCIDFHKGLQSEAVVIDLQEQVDIYNAALTAINNRDWIDGFVSRGYFPLIASQDGSASVYGKPAWDVLWYWYPRLLAYSQ
jgi:hypothetical protein